jgi:hypothetical protein
MRAGRGSINPASLASGFLDQSRGLPAIALSDFVVEALLIGIDVSFHECPKRGLQLDDLRRVIKIHGYPLSNAGVVRSSLVS